MCIQAWTRSSWVALRWLFSKDPVKRWKQEFLLFFSYQLIPLSPSTWPKKESQKWKKTETMQLRFIFSQVWLFFKKLQYPECSLSMLYHTKPQLRYTHQTTTQQKCFHFKNGSLLKWLFLSGIHSSSRWDVPFGNPLTSALQRPGITGLNPSKSSSFII